MKGQGVITSLGAAHEPGEVSVHQETQIALLGRGEAASGTYALSLLTDEFSDSTADDEERGYGQTGPNGEDLRPRGIYKLKRKVEGCDAYFALTRNGADVPPGLRVVWPGVSEDSVLMDLARALERADPIRPRLTLI